LENDCEVQEDGTRNKGEKIEPCLKVVKEKRERKSIEGGEYEDRPGQGQELLRLTRGKKVGS